MKTTIVLVIIILSIIILGLFLGLIWFYTNYKSTFSQSLIYALHSEVNKIEISGDDSNGILWIAELKDGSIKKYYDKDLQGIIKYVILTNKNIDNE